MIDPKQYRPRKHLSPSSCSCLSGCPRKFFYKYGLGLFAPRSRAAMDYGSAIHYGLPYCYQRGGSAHALAAFSKVWNSELDDDKRNTQRAQATFIEFEKIHCSSNCIYQIVKPPEGAKAQEKVSDNEVAFAIDIGLPIPIVGRVDALGRHRDSGELWGVEYKTSYIVTANFVSGFSLSPQILTYALALSILSPKKVRGMFLEAIRTSKTRAETLTFPIHVEEQSLDRIVDWYEYWYKELTCLEDEFFNDGKLFRTEPSACTPYACHGVTGYTCDYQSLCLQPDKEIHNHLGLFDIAPEKPFLVAGE